MALRAFHANPSLGGFGGESTPFNDTSSNAESILRNKNKPISDKTESITNASADSGDALCQIVKELVDNAVDACNGTTNKNSENSTATTKVFNRKVQVDIVPLPNQETNNNTLQITVSDTGCGMADIQKSVNAFQSTKAGRTDDESDDVTQQQTAGRYGIGLTLCLVHAQRLVPGSHACITSTTANGLGVITRASFVVDTEEDKVECTKLESTTNEAAESGTCVSLLIPGGELARRVWPRLANYFRRFSLNPNFHCTIQVYAPTLAKQPIYIRPNRSCSHSKESSIGMQEEEATSPVGTSSSSSQETNSDDHLAWNDPLGENRNHSSSDASKSNEDTVVDQEMVRRLAAVHSYLKPSIKVENVVYATRSIRISTNATGDSEKKQYSTSATLEIIMAIDPEAACDGGAHGGTISSTTGRVEFVRLVNGIPLMDGADVHSCGLVQGITSKMTWGSFGLHIEPSSSQAIAWTPTFGIRDSDQVAPFFQQMTHRVWKDPSLVPQDDEEHDTVEAGSQHSTNNKKRSRMELPETFLPAGVRLGSVLVVGHITAAPSALPLQTLSKGRLPLNSKPIDNALQLALRDCLRNIQKSNPDLLLASTQLKEAERDARFIPSVAMAVSQMISCELPAEGDLTPRLVEMVQHWGIQSETRQCPIHGESGEESVDSTQILRLVEGRIKESVLMQQLKSSEEPTSDDDDESQPLLPDLLSEDESDEDEVGASSEDGSDEDEVDVGASYCSETILI